MRVHHLNCGTMCPVSARLINGSGGWLARGRMICHCLLLETADGLALVDTGLGTGDIADPRGRLNRQFIELTGPRLVREETALAELEQLGFLARDVRHIVPTHLDLDHVGGLSDFPDAVVHVHADEHAAAMARRTRRERNRYRPLQWAHQPRWQLHRQGGDRWFGFESVRALPNSDDEVLLVPLPGHTRGHAAVAVRSDRGWLLHAGDAYFFHGEIHGAVSHCPPGLSLFQRLIAMDNEARLRNRDRLRALAQAHGGEVRIFSAHCPVELERERAAVASATGARSVG
jgi:glyoxylase-like metal-dependent hydrolase (beta-lactamase superfamily II)